MDIFSPHKAAPPFAHSSGPKDAKIAFVGEAWGEQEDLIGRPFVGSSGQELTRMMQEAGIERKDCFLTNTLALRPIDNNLKHLCCKKKELPSGYDYPPFAGAGNYLRPEYLPEIERLRIELETVNPNIIVPLGNPACWALMGMTKISALRGSAAYGTLLPTTKLIPTYHPAAVMRNWTWRVIVLADLMKIKREADRREIVRPERWVLVDPTFTEIDQWINEHVRCCKKLGVDIETAGGLITSIGFSVSERYAMVIPLADKRKPGGHAWETLEDEIEIWNIIERLLRWPVTKVFQNGMYDLRYILDLGLQPTMLDEDTMLKHHSIYPELQKSLGFMGSIHTNEASWKLMRHRKKDEEGKKDE